MAKHKKKSELMSESEARAWTMQILKAKEDGTDKEKIKELSQIIVERLFGKRPEKKENS